MQSATVELFLFREVVLHKKQERAALHSVYAVPEHVGVCEDTV